MTEFKPTYLMVLKLSTLVELSEKDCLDAGSIPATSKIINSA